MLSQMPDNLLSLVSQAEPAFSSFDATKWNASRGEGKWTRLQLLGHLIDSAANNHQRFVRALAEKSLEWPGYDQIAHVICQNYAMADSRPAPIPLERLQPIPGSCYAPNFSSKSLHPLRHRRSTSYVPSGSYPRLCRASRTPSEATPRRTIHHVFGYAMASCRPKPPMARLAHMPRWNRLGNETLVG